MGAPGKEKQRELLVRVEVEGHTVRRAAAQCGVPRSTAAAWVRAFREDLRRVSGAVRVLGE